MKECPICKGRKQHDFVCISFSHFLSFLLHPNDFSPSLVFFSPCCSPFMMLSPTLYLIQEPTNSLSISKYPIISPIFTMIRKPYLYLFALTQILLLTSASLYSTLKLLLCAMLWRTHDLLTCAMPSFSLEPCLHWVLLPDFLWAIVSLATLFPPIFFVGLSLSLYS